MKTKQPIIFSIFLKIWALKLSITFANLKFFDKNLLNQLNNFFTLVKYFLVKKHGYRKYEIQDKWLRYMKYKQSFIFLYWQKTSQKTFKQRHNS